MPCHTLLGIMASRRVAAPVHFAERQDGDPNKKIYESTKSTFTVPRRIIGETDQLYVLQPDFGGTGSPARWRAAAALPAASSASSNGQAAATGSLILVAGLGIILKTYRKTGSTEPTWNNSGMDGKGEFKY